MLIDSGNSKICLLLRIIIIFRLVSTDGCMAEVRLGRSAELKLKI